jgi:methyl-accepting chemotaxis protein
MSRFGLLHHHPGHRARQLRWVLPSAVLVIAAVLATLAVQYRVSDQAVGTEFFRAHKTITHTGEQLERGTIIAGAVLVLVVVALGIWALRFTHRIVRPVHTVHRAIDALATGDLGVRVELHGKDEFAEIAHSLNRLVDEVSTTLGTVHGLVDDIDRLTAAAAGRPLDATQVAEIGALVRELDRRMEFFRLEPRRSISEDDC